MCSSGVVKQNKLYFTFCAKGEKQAINVPSDNGARARVRAHVRVCMCDANDQYS